jgi:hypothetical protein
MNRDTLDLGDREVFDQGGPNCIIGHLFTNKISDDSDDGTLTTTAILDNK